MATPQAPLPTSPDRRLPAIAIDGHALFEFSLKMNRALKRLEYRFGACDATEVPLLRKAWQPAPRKPR
jgi:hypothetical protein